VILSTDLHLLDFIKELGLQDELFWCETKSGFYGDGKLVSMSSTLDFVTFPFMSLWQKFRLALGILYSARIKDPSKLDRIYVRQWLTMVFGRRIYENIWDPLLRSKLGDARQRTSAAFIWATITRLYGARESGSKREKMGHVHGGYLTILKAAESKLNELGVQVFTGSAVSAVKNQTNSPDSTSGITVGSKCSREPIGVVTSKGTLKFDRVLLTVDCPSALWMIDSVNDHPYWDQLREVEYLSVVCVLLILERKLSPYYVINLLDKNLPFTGIIEATNVVSPEEIGDKHLVYLPKYMPADDPMNSWDDHRITEIFLKNLRKVFPDLRDKEILHRQIFRERYVQPLQELNFLERTRDFRTPLPGVYLVNTSMIYNSTLNNNAVVALAKGAADTILQDTHDCDDFRDLSR
jgi:protoporphyrinogen oxidase